MATTSKQTKKRSSNADELASAASQRDNIPPSYGVVLIPRGANAKWYPNKTFCILPHSSLKEIYAEYYPTHITGARKMAIDSLEAYRFSNTGAEYKLVEIKEI